MVSDFRFMYRPIIIGITGGIGSGKTTISEILQNNGYFVYNSDSEARRIQNENEKVRKLTSELFGDDIYVHNELNRKKVASMVFGNPELLKKLSSIVHPAVEEDFHNWILKHFDADFLFFESAIMFEAGFNKMVDKVILITASEDERIRRVVNRDGSNIEQVKSRMSHQLDENLIKEKVDAIVNTENGPPDINFLNNIIAHVIQKK